MTPSILFLSVAVATLFPPTPSNSSKYRVIPVLGGVLIAGMLAVPTWQPAPLVLPLVIFGAILVAGTPFRNRDWMCYLFPDHEGDSVLHQLLCLGLAGLAGGFGAAALPGLILLGPAVALTAYWQLWVRKSLGRCQGTLQNPVFLGGTLAPLIVLALSAGVWWAAAVSLPALWFSRSRGGLFGSVVGGSMILARSFPSPGLATLLFIGIGAGCLVGFDARARDWAYEWVVGRGYLWRGTLKKIAKRLWLGYGPGPLNLEHENASNQYGRAVSKNPHNLFLHYTYAYGLVGVAAYVCVLSKGFAGALPVFVPALIAYLVWGMTAWDHVVPGYLFWLMLGLANGH